MSDEEYGPEDVEDKIQTVINNEEKKRRTVKYHILRRQMTQRGAPDRMLTWDAIEQIRYLKQEQPEEWTVERLAEGFSVSPDAILRVLRSKFIPSPKRKANQDAKVIEKLNQRELPSGAKVRQEKQRLPAGITQAALTSGERTVVPVGHQSELPQTEHIPAALSVVTTKPDLVMTTTTVSSQEEDQPTDSAVDEEDWDRQVFSEEDIDELILTLKSSPLVKVGNEFFDKDGNFMYRI